MFFLSCSFGHGVATVIGQNTGEKLKEEVTVNFIYDPYIHYPEVRHRYSKRIEKHTDPSEKVIVLFDQELTSRKAIIDSNRARFSLEIEEIYFFESKGFECETHLETNEEICDDTYRVQMDMYYKFIDNELGLIKLDSLSYYKNTRVKWSFLLKEVKTTNLWSPYKEMIKQSSIYVTRDFVNFIVKNYEDRLYNPNHF